MADAIVTLWKYRDLPEALIARAKLEAEGIECYLADENIVRLNWFLSNAIGGMRLQLLQENAGVAMEVLGQDIPVSFNAEEIGEEYVQPRCLKCNSLDVKFEEYSGLSLAILWLLSVPIPVRRNRWKCEDCSFKWKETDDSSL